jgi:hypothetical protein
MNTLKQHYMGSMYFTIVALTMSFVYGMYSIGTIGAGVSALVIAMVLGALEVSLSFDNAVANAKTLETMTPEWQHRFITWGMVVAVFGMRVVFPVLIVSITGGVSMYEAMKLAIYEPKKYAEVLEASHIMIASFGGAFLLLVGLNFFLDEEKETHWFGALEIRLQMIGSALGTTIVLIVLVVFYKWVIPADVKDVFLVAGLLGIVAHEIIARIGDSMEGDDDLTVSVAKNGLASFLYLEVLDMSMSFDGVIGAFAITTNIVTIALGLGIGAMFVRSMTIHLVESGTLSEYKYLEHGAFYSILILAGIMFTSTVVEIPEIVTGLLSVSLIGFAWYWSVRENKLEALTAE